VEAIHLVELGDVGRDGGGVEAPGRGVVPLRAEVDTGHDVGGSTVGVHPGVVLGHLVVVDGGVRHAPQGNLHTVLHEALGGVDEDVEDVVAALRVVGVARLLDLGAVVQLHAIQVHGGVIAGVVTLRGRYLAVAEALTAGQAGDQRCGQHQVGQCGTAHVRISSR